MTDAEKLEAIRQWLIDNEDLENMQDEEARGGWWVINEIENLLK